MKTFKLKSLVIIDNKDKNMVKHNIELIDGLIINREDEESLWVIEAYTSNANYAYLKSVQENKNEVIIEVKITKETNAPVFFLTSIIGLNNINDNMNVLFKGTIINQQKSRTEELLKKLIDQGYEGEELFSLFKQQMRTKNNS